MAMMAGIAYCLKSLEIFSVPSSVGIPMVIICEFNSPAHLRKSAAKVLKKVS